MQRTYAPSLAKHTHTHRAELQYTTGVLQHLVHGIRTLISSLTNRWGERAVATCTLAYFSAVNVLAGAITLFVSRRSCVHDGVHRPAMLQTSVPRHRARPWECTCGTNRDNIDTRECHCRHAHVLAHTWMTGHNALQMRRWRVARPKSKTDSLRGSETQAPVDTHCVQRLFRVSRYTSCTSPFQVISDYTSASPCNANGAGC